MAVAVTKTEEAPHILLLEDDENLNRLYCGVLQRAGYRVSQAHTVAEAMEILQQKPVLLIVTDWHLPDGTGAPVCDLARQQNPPMPVLLISGQADRHSLTEGNTQVSAWLSKPVLADSLLSTVGQLIGNSVSRHKNNAYKIVYVKR